MATSPISPRRFRGDEKRPSTAAAPAAVGEGAVDVEADREDDLHREMKPRQLNMMAIAGAIGTGLIIGTGSGLRSSGPAALLIGYVLMGFVVYVVMVALGEMGAWLPHKKAFSGYASRFVDPAVGFATGWNYWLKYVIGLASNLTATGIILQYWRPDINVSVWIVTFGVAVVALNLIHVSFFGEAEFWMSAVKAVVIAMLILLCFSIALGAGPATRSGSGSGSGSGFWYWHDPGAFDQYGGVPGAAGRLLAVWSAVVQAAFSYLGTELVAVAFGETPDPKRNVPRAVNHTLFRIALFYVLAVLVLGMAVRYDDPLLADAVASKKTSGATSPSVIAAVNAGIGHLDHAVNGLLLVFTVSAANSDIYIASRTVWALAKDGQAPRLLRHTNDRGVPVAAVLLSSAFIGLGFMNATKSASTVFGYFVSMVTMFGALNWLIILISYLSMVRAMRVQAVPRSLMPYRNPLLPAAAYPALAVVVLIVVLSGVGNGAFVPEFRVDRFVTSYIGIPIYVFNVLWWKLAKRTRVVAAGEMDLVTGRRTWDD